MLQQLTPYIDKEIDFLRQEIRELEDYLQQLSTEKIEIEKLIYEFGIRHTRELGLLLLDILKQKKESAKGTSNQTEYENDYNKFCNDYETTKDNKTHTLTEVEKEDIKNKYRKASKLCHPDVVDEKHKEKAHKIFMALNKAYENNDLKQVTEILNNLENGQPFLNKFETKNEKVELQKQIEQLRVLVSELENEIAKLKRSEAYQKIINIENWEEYFNKSKRLLQSQLNQLQNG